jgi:hypothetical protein
MVAEPVTVNITIKRGQIVIWSGKGLAEAPMSVDFSKWDGIVLLGGAVPRRFLAFDYIPNVKAVA